VSDFIDKLLGEVGHDLDIQEEVARGARIEYETSTDNITRQANKRMKETETDLFIKELLGE